MTEPAKAQLLQMLLMQAENPDIDTRDQIREEINSPDNPGVAPGWNVLMVLDVVAGMFIMGAIEQAESQETEETPGLSDHELEELAPGITKAIRERITSNIPSEQLYRALYEEIREVARGTIEDMPPGHRHAVMDAAARKIREAQPGAGRTGPVPGQTGGAAAPTERTGVQDRGPHKPKLDWERIVTKTDAAETTGEIYQAVLKSGFTGKITLRIGRHPGWPKTWHILAECRGHAKQSIVGDEPGPMPLMLRMETFAERWALAGTMPNLL